MSKIYITQQYNEKYFEGKLHTWRNGYCYINRKVTLVDLHDVFDGDEYGYITVRGQQVFVISGGDDNWEIYK